MLDMRGLAHRSFPSEDVVGAQIDDVKIPGSCGKVAVGGLEMKGSFQNLGGTTTESLRLCVDWTTAKSRIV
jgi:hypothetical protein